MDTETDKKEIAADWWFVAVDQTREWCLDRLPHAQHIARIMTVLQFDRNRHVHCCEIAPSYECWPVRYQVLFKGLDDLPSREVERIQEIVEQEVRQPFADEGVTYYHVTSLDYRMKQVGVPAEPKDPKWPVNTYGMDFATGWAFARYGATGTPLKDTNDDLEKAYDEQREAVLEWYHGTEVF